MKRLLLITVSVVFVAVSLSFVACDSEDKKEYDATITWTVGGLQTCSSSKLPTHGDVFLDFTQMIIKIYDDEKDVTEKPEATVLNPIPVPCADLEYTVRKLERGTYWAMASTKTQ